MSSSIVLEKMFADGICTVYRARALVVLAWHATPTANSAVRLSRALVATMGGNAAGTLMCALSDTEMPMPDSAAREALQGAILRLGPLRGAVTVILGTGFRAAALRAMLSGFSMMVRQRYPMSFVAAEGEATTFLLANWPDGDSPPPSRSDLMRVLGDVKPVYAAAISP